MKFLASIVLASAVLCSHALAADITGKVLGPDGKPVKNATIYYFQYPGNDVPAPTTRRDAPRRARMTTAITISPKSTGTVNLSPRRMVLASVRCKIRKSVLLPAPI